ncbi:MAG: DUF5009 domain-containing protein [Betaproteobacteria bacterium]|nr:MAG: DUF5009 domain-containing protein [Betaproteobacteria bacterium]
MKSINALRSGRVLSIDAFRGITFVAMIFVNELGGVSDITRWLKHMPADADAMSFPDIVFPAFLFIVGMAIPFSLNARIASGDDAWQLQKHVVYRALGLIVMGVFMVNAEAGFNAAAMPISIHVWSLLFYAAAFLIWGVFRFENPRVTRALRVTGLLLIVALAAVYRGGDGTGWMTPQWWGILGLIGWAYFFCCEFYLLSRGRLWGLLAALVFCVAYYAAAHRGGLESSWHWLFSQEAHAAHSQIVLAGIVCALIFFDAERPDRERRRFIEAALLGVVLVVAGFALRPVFGISKIYATPSWCLYCAAICVATFAFLYALIEIRQRVRWTRLVEPAASNPLVTYLLPFVVEATLELLGLELPAILRQGAAGLVWAALYAALIVWIVSRLNRRGVRLKL